MQPGPQEGPELQSQSSAMLGTLSCPLKPSHCTARPAWPSSFVRGEIPCQPPRRLLATAPEPTGPRGTDSPAPRTVLGEAGLRGSPVLARTQEGTDPHWTQPLLPAAPPHDPCPGREPAPCPASRTRLLPVLLPASACARPSLPPLLCQAAAAFPGQAASDWRRVLSVSLAPRAHWHTGGAQPSACHGKRPSPPPQPAPHLAFFLAPVVPARRELARTEPGQPPAAERRHAAAAAFFVFETHTHSLAHAHAHTPSPPP